MAGEASLGKMHRLFAISHLDRDNNTDFPLNMKQIALAQKNNVSIKKFILRHGKDHTNLGTIIINGTQVTTFKDKVWVPKELQERIVDWYHSSLQHSGVNHMINTSSQTFTWKGV
jgi:hypothetical protein